MPDERPSDLNNQASKPSADDVLIIDSPSRGVRKIAVNDLLAEAPGGSGLDPNNAALTGTTTADAISPNVHAIGNVGSGGTIALHATKQVNTATVTAGSATVTLPASPVDGERTLLLTFTGNVVVNITTPSLIREDIDGTTAVTSIQFPASTNGSGRVTFTALGGAYRSMRATGDIVAIPSSMLVGLSSNGAMTGGASEFPNCPAVATYFAAQLDGFEIPYSRVNNFPTARIAGRYSSGTGVLEGIQIGSGLSLIGGVLSAASGGASTPAVISGTDIDWSVSGTRFKTISANYAPTFSNAADGQTIRVLITATGSYSVTWPGNVVGAPSQTASASDWYQLTRVGNSVVCTRLNSNLTIDTTAPTLSSATINTDGNLLPLVFSKSVVVGSGGSGGFVLTLTGGAVTATYSSGAGSNTLLYSLTGRVVSAGESGTIAYTQPGNGIEDASGNDLASIASATVTNSSSASTYIRSIDFNSGTIPSNVTVTIGTVNWNFTPPLTGTGSTYAAENNTNGSAWYLDLGADYTDIWLFFYADYQTATTGNVIEFRNSAGTKQAGFDIRSDRFNSEHGTSSGGHVQSMTGLSDPSVFWVHYKAETTPGTSADGLLEVFANANSTSESIPGGSRFKRDTGTGDAIRRIYFTAAGRTLVQYGKIRVAASAIGNNPV